MKNTKTQPSTFLLSMACLLSAAHGQLTPSQDPYINTASPTGSFGAKTLLDVESASQTTYIQFDLPAIRSGYTGSNITKATLKLYVSPEAVSSHRSEKPILRTKELKKNIRRAP